MFGVVDDTTTTKFTSRACAVHCNSLPIVVDKAVVVVLKFPNRAWTVEKSAVKTDIQLEKDHKLVSVGKYSICKKYLPFQTFVDPLQNKLIIN